MMGSIGRGALIFPIAVLLIVAGLLAANGVSHVEAQAVGTTARVEVDMDCSTTAVESQIDVDDNDTTIDLCISLTDVFLPGGPPHRHSGWEYRLQYDDESLTPISITKLTDADPDTPGDQPWNEGINANCFGPFTDGEDDIGTAEISYQCQVDSGNFLEQLGQVSGVSFAYTKKGLPHPTKVKQFFDLLPYPQNTGPIDGTRVFCEAGTKKACETITLVDGSVSVIPQTPTPTNTPTNTPPPPPVGGISIDPDQRVLQSAAADRSGLSIATVAAISAAAAAASVGLGGVTWYARRRVRG